MNRLVITLSLCVFASHTLFGAEQDSGTAGIQNSQKADHGERLLFPKNFIRGYADFEVAPPHNEIDTGFCALLVTNTDFQTHPTCTAYARYSWSGYIEIQPIGRGPLRRVFLFYSPKYLAGETLPQRSYTWSAAPILLEGTMGIGVELRKNLEFRLTHHSVEKLGRYTTAAGVATLRTDGPYGLYNTAGVRWYFGGWGRQGSR